MGDRLHARCGHQSMAWFPNEMCIRDRIDIVNNDTMTGRFDVVISNVKAPNGVRSVSVPIWSETGGQDDLVWYTANRQANGTYTVNVKAADHKNSTGLYLSLIHI